MLIESMMFCWTEMFISSNRAVIGRRIRPRSITLKWSITLSLPDHASSHIEVSLHTHTYIHIYIYIYMYIYMYTSVLHIYKHHVVMINFGEKIREILHEFLCLGPFWEQMLLDSHDFGIMDPRIVISSAMHHTKGEHLFDAWISHLRDSSA